MEITRIYERLLYHIVIFSEIILSMALMVPASHPDTFLSTVELVQKYGYPLETHEIITEDGYIISMFRIPHGQKGNKINEKPLLMMHGILSQAEFFIINGMNNGSWAYHMADNGYDVWLGNTRETPHGRKHLVLDPEQKEFWNFSFHEMGLYDLPALIDYILETTNKSRLSYIATSQGCTIFYVMCSLKEEYQKKITLASFLAPAGYMKHFSYPLFLPFAMVPKQLQYSLEKSGIFEFPMRRVLSICALVLGDLCIEVCHSFFGGRTGEFNDEMFPLMARYVSSISVHQVLHFAQQISSGHFRPFDYGTEINMEIYEKPLPEDYPIKIIKVPIAMYYIYSIGDSIIAFKDVEETCDALPNCVRRFILPNKKWNHMDYVFSIHLTKELIEPVIEFSQKYEI